MSYQTLQIRNRMSLKFICESRQVREYFWQYSVFVTSGGSCENQHTFQHLTVHHVSVVQRFISFFNRVSNQNK